MRILKRKHNGPSQVFVLRCLDLRTVRAELSALRSMSIHVGEHYCDFALEKLVEDEFAIVCESHPPLRRQSAA